MEIWAGAGLSHEELMEGLDKISILLMGPSVENEKGRYQVESWGEGGRKFNSST